MNAAGTRNPAAGTRNFHFVFFSESDSLRSVFTDYADRL